ncbi:uncharacterized protein L969DRAFT_18446 [Mixia osmundae IAM 14324]|uniref:Uncharacterized protein n=1 Tax=Mixia osmundae (strain CBS 9802 / IAM 14324 / JCM 22182 / KY 12970) TaxID=764103 RepID=G7E7M2_MIXOS|nr:uncharacterized protein L969DRAFT_18446 [Mixia osmundae IAM 14324]KEI38432.1 hypothetical protein L969DRAFT_18446 [Mixia osmundae IAM 14324]GAA98832.1 hypothetical protein E5Q_05520 [Mixia osmundae IAM 14324]
MSTNSSFPGINNSTLPNQLPGNGNGLSAAVYYGAVAVAVFVIAAITIASRIIYARKVRARTRRDINLERIDQSRRGEADGLPTYRETTHNLAGTQPLPATGVDANAHVLAEDVDVNGNPVSPAAQHSHFHFHFPSLPAALHIRPRLNRHATDVSDARSVHNAPPAYAGPDAPKYEEGERPAVPSSGHTDTTTPSGARADDLEMGEMTQPSLPPAIDIAITPPAEPDSAYTAALDHATLGSEPAFVEPFLHPEELRRNQRDIAARGRSS